MALSGGGGKSGGGVDEFEGEEGGKGKGKGKGRMPQLQEAIAEADAAGLPAYCKEEPKQLQYLS